MTTLMLLGKSAQWLHRYRLIGAGAMLVVVVLGGLWVKAGWTHPIDSYQACVEEGLPVLETDPPICRDGKNSFTGTPLPKASPGPIVSSVNFDTLVDGDTHSDYPHKQLYLANDKDWQSYWRSVHAALPSVPPILPVDFKTSGVVAVTMGQKTTGGYGLKITNITTSSVGSTVDVSESTPAVGCMVTQSITNRYLIVRTDKLTEPVTFRISPSTRQCQ